MLSRDEFAEAVLIQLATRGETTAVYDPATFRILHTPQLDGTNASAWTQLDRWYEKYQSADRVGRGDEAIEDVAEAWESTLKFAKSESPLNKSRLVPLVRSRFDYEVSSLQTALQLKRQPRELMEVFVHQPLAEHLDVILAEDAPDRYNQVTRPILQQLGLSWEEALRLAMWNLPQIDPGFGSGQPFQQREAGYWVYAAEPSELFTSWLLFPERIRRLPVKGKHVAFAPKVSLLAITGTDEIEGLRRLISLTCEALQKQGGRVVSAVPFVLEATGWKPWLPPASHPLYWAIKELHITDLDSDYEAQEKLLDELVARDHGDEAPFVAAFKVGQFGEHSHSGGGPRSGAPILTSQCVWTQTLDSLLPRTEVVILTQLLNQAELEQNENAEPQFGERATITWRQLADYLGSRLKKLDYYPERYQVSGDDFPVGDDWKRLAAAQAALPLEGSPGAKPAPLPTLAPLVTAEAVGPTAATPTQLARPLAPPAEPKPPPEPSLWPLALLCLFGLTCLGGGVGTLVVGIQWLHGALQSAGANDIAQAEPAVHPAIQQQPPILRPIQPQPDAMPEPRDLPEMQEEIRAAVRQIQAQFEEAIDRGAPDVSPLEPLPDWPPREPPPDTLPPLPDLEKPEQALPPLTFGPTDLQPLGREIHGDHLFQDIAPAGGWLVGLRVTKGRPWNGAIVALQPIYQVGGEYHLGQSCGSGQQALEHVQHLAKPGYAIGKIEARIGLIMNALRIEFQRVHTSSLVPADSYTTEWFGADGGSLQVFDGRGSPLVGLAGSFQPEGEIITIQVLRKKP